MIFQEPLQWPNQQPRTKNQKRANFANHSITKGSNELTSELKLLGAKNVIITSDLRQRKDNMGPWSNQRIDEPGIAVYFELNGEPKTMACDKWDRIEHNIWALCLSIKAIRGLERWGGSEFLDGLFTGFKALPAPGQSAEMEVRYFSDVTNPEHLQLKFKQLAKQLHPDTEGGDSEKFQEMMKQHKQLKENLDRQQ